MAYDSKTCRRGFVILTCSVHVPLCNCRHTHNNPKVQTHIAYLHTQLLRDRNHASIIMWSIGNEASYGHAHDAIYRLFKQLDPSRPVHYESCGGAAATDVLCPMYPSVDKLKKLAGTYLHATIHRRCLVLPAPGALRTY